MVLVTNREEEVERCVYIAHSIVLSIRLEVVYLVMTFRKVINELNKEANNDPNKKLICLERTCSKW